MNTTDDRGRIVELARLDRGTPTRGTESPLRYSAEQLNRQRKSEGFNLLLLLTTLGGLLILINSYFSLPTATTLPVASWLIPLAGLVLMVMVFRIALRRADRIHSIHHMPSIGLCPACGYGIRGVPPESDGCTVCPECGAAWVVPPQTEPPSSAGKPAR